MKKQCKDCKALDPLVTPNEVLRIVKIDKTTLNGWIRDGTFPKPYIWKRTYRNVTKRWTIKQVVDFVRKGKPGAI